MYVGTQWLLEARLILQLLDIQLCTIQQQQYDFTLSLVFYYTGKSTTLKLITRMLEVDSGSILVDGVNISNVTKESVRSRVAVVPQDNCLFDDTGKWIYSILYPYSSTAHYKQFIVLSNSLAHLRIFFV